MKRDLYEEVSTRIVAELERGAAPWVKPWSATPGRNVRPRMGFQESQIRLPRARGTAWGEAVAWRLASDPWLCK
jgi:hypothetical protein